MTAARAKVAVLGVFNADLAFEAERLPQMGETLLGEGFRMGPGGKGSNQAVAAARAGADVAFITRIGADAFGGIARKIFGEAGVKMACVIEDAEQPTNSAFIFVSTRTGDNAIIVASGAGGALSEADVDAHMAAIGAAKVFVTQLEQPIAAAAHGLKRAREAGVATILKPAPALDLPSGMLGHVDYLTPNETEAARLSGRHVGSLDEARAAADALLAKGAKAVVLTLGERGALYHDGATSTVTPAIRAPQVVDTTGAGDAFNGAFATALAEGRTPPEAVRFACAAASLSVRQPGAAAAMPAREAIDALLQTAPPPSC